MTEPTPKIHPATRELMPDDPMEMTGVEIEGDPALMLRLLVEEYARIGYTAHDILQLARDPNFQAFHGLWRLMGAEQLHARVHQVVARCGVMRVKHTEAPPVEDLVQLNLD